MKISKCPVCGSEHISVKIITDGYGYLWHEVTCEKGHTTKVKKLKGASNDGT